MGLSFDSTISVGLIVQTCIMAGGGVAALAVMNATVKTIKEDMAASKKATSDAFAGFQTELKELSKALIVMARSEERIASLDQRVTTHDKQIEGLRRGHGYIERRDGTKVIDREY